MMTDWQNDLMFMTMIKETSGSTSVGKFLGLELFDPNLDDEDPKDIIETYREPVKMRCYAMSKWNFTDNTPSEMRRCEVLEYISDQELYVIKW